MEYIIKWSKYLCALIVVLVFAAHNPVLAEEVKTTMLFNYDIVNPENGESFNKQNLYVGFVYEDFLAGIELNQTPKYDYFQTKTYAGLTRGPWTGFLGLSFDSNDSDYAFGGFWYCGPLGRLKTFLDIRYYAGMKKEADDFFDSYLRLTYSLGKWGLGIDGLYDVWDSEKYSYFLGPVVTYKINDNIIIGARVTRDYDIIEDETSRAIRLRLEMNFFF